MADAKITTKCIVCSQSVVLRQRSDQAVPLYEPLAQRQRDLLQVRAEYVLQAWDTLPDPILILMASIPQLEQLRNAIAHLRAGVETVNGG